MILRSGLLALVLVGVVCGSAQAQRLPGGVRPVHYALTITPDLARARFSGSETIEVVLDKPTSAITLNAAEIEFVSVKAEVGTALSDIRSPLSAEEQGRGSEAAKVTLDAEKEQATFTFARPLSAGPVTLTIEYTGILNDRLRGFYLSKTKLRNYGVTQFEATDARRAFPCFDEPALKATFDVALTIDEGDTAISNMPVVSDRPVGAGKHMVRFATTPKMSTYLVAWLVGDFRCTEGKSDGVPIRACATPDKVKLTGFALEAAKWNLKYYDRYFGIKYPLPKLDLIAVPDFEAGAMENFGCITFRETEMLVDAKNGGIDAKKEVAETVAHEMSHQWFGDLVTPAWWDNLWLNEGFATWMETKAAGVWQPKWEFAEDVALEKDRTMNEDAGRTTRAIRSEAETPAEIDALFDDIVYGKAGAVIAMVENWVGEETFRKGVQAYLAAHAYGNATAEDFWDAQTQVSGLPVDKVMRSFVDQPGVPMVSLQDRAGAGYGVSDGRFFISPRDRPHNPCEGMSMEEIAHSECMSPYPAPFWTVPVCVKGDGCKVVGQSPEIVNAPASGFLYANAEDKGYYRTGYAAGELKAIVANAETGLDVPERIGLLGDQWALMRSGQGQVGDFLDLVLAVKHDSSAEVMDMALGKVGTIEAKIASADDRKRMDAVVRREFGPVYAALGKRRHESLDQAELRETLFEELGRAQDASVLAEAEQETEQLLSGRKAVDPALADADVSLATVKGDSAMYDKLLAVSGVTNDPDLKEAALTALTRFEDPALVSRTLEYAVSDAVRNQDSWVLIALLLAQRETQDQAWDFLEQHWAQIERKLTSGSGVRIVEAAGSFCTVEKRDAVAKFFREHPVPGAELTLAKALDSIGDCVQLRAAQEPKLHQWLDEQTQH